MEYIDNILLKLEKSYPCEKEYLQAVREVFYALSPAVEKNLDEIKDFNILERLAESERILTFKVVWKDRNENVCVNRGYRVQHSSLLGPFKGGIRFSPDVDLSVMKFLAFEQTFKNSLTTLPLGGAKGGADFDPRGKTDGEIENFAKAFIFAAHQALGSDLDVAAGDIGVGEKEIGYFVGAMKKLRAPYAHDTFTGKPQALYGCPLRDKATGYGAVYFLKNLLDDRGESIDGLTFALSGFGSVARGAAEKIISLGGTVKTLSGRDGFMLFEKGLTLEGAKAMKAARENKVSKADFAKAFGGTFCQGHSPFGDVAADVYFPSATQNEIDERAALAAVKLGVKYLVEGANMPTTHGGLKVFKNAGVAILPGKAANAGGVATSYFEMMQNKQGESFTEDAVDKKLADVMEKIYRNIVLTNEKYCLSGDFVTGANICAFERLKTAMILLGT